MASASPRAMAKKRLDRQLDALAGRLLALALLGVLTATAAFGLAATFQASIERNVGAEQALNLSNNGMLNQETGLRAFLLGHDVTFLQPYTEGQAQVAQGDRDISALTAGDSQITAMLSDLRSAQDHWIYGWASTAAGGGAPQTDAFDVEGKQLFDAYRAVETKLATTVDQRLRDAARLSVTFRAAGIAMECLLGLAMVVSWRRSRRLLRSAVIEPVQAIRRSMAGMAAGDLHLPTVVAGAAEFQSIHESLRELAEALAAAKTEAAVREAQGFLQAERLRLLVTMSRDIAGSLNLGYVLAAVASSTQAISGFPRVVVWLTDTAGRRLDANFDSDGIKGAVIGIEAIEIGEGIVGKAARYGRSIGPEQIAAVAATEASTQMAIPMVVGARVVGIIQTLAPTGWIPDSDMLAMLDSLSGQAATGIEAARLYASAERLSETDALTGCANRRRMDSDFAREHERASRHGRKYAFAMADVDNFKLFNDNHGHQRADEVLQEIAAVLAGAIRRNDTLYRYGGEEFALLLPETDLATAHIVCERLRTAIEQRFAKATAVGPVTISIGVAGFPDPDGGIATTTIGRADAALYQAKHEGRNRVVAESAADA